MAIITNPVSAAPGFDHRVETSAIDPEILRLRMTNELWSVYAPEWEFYLSAFEGGKDFAKGDNLFQHQRENPADFEDRCQRVHYFNYCENLVDFFTKFIFSETIQRDGGTNNDFYQSFTEDVNRRGDDITEYMKNVCDDMQVFGMSYTLVDAPVIPQGEPLTKQTEEDLNIRPYWVLVKPSEILDWETDDFDNLVYAKRVQYVTHRGNEKFEKYTEWTPDFSKITIVSVTDSHKPKIVGTPEIFVNALGEIPITAVRFKRSKRYPFMGNSFLRNFAYNSKEVMNYTSLLQEFLYRQAFNILAKEVDTSISFQDQNDGAIGTSNVLEFPKGANAPSYITPPVEPAQFIQDERAKIVNEMFRLAAQDTLNELFNGEKRSGFSQAQSFSKTVPFIASRADTLERAENAFMELTMKFMNKTWDGKIKYKDHYELTNIQDAISQLLQVFRDLMIPSELFVKEELKRLVHELDGKIPAEKLTKIEKEIEAMDFEKWQETQKLALIGNSGKSPGAQAQPKQTGTMAEVQAEAKVTKTAAASKAKPPKNKS